MTDLGQMLNASTGQPRDMREALQAAQKAQNPAEAVQHLYLALAYAEQQLSALEQMAAGDDKARQGVIARGRRKMLSVVGQ
jgi:hypothetical protein